MTADSPPIPNEPNPRDAEAAHSQGTRILISIVCLVCLYLFSKWLKSRYEPKFNTSTISRGVRGDGFTRHHWHYSDLILHPIHCNVCHTLLLTVKGQFCSNCGIGSCLSPACIQKADLAHICKEVACFGKFADDPTERKKFRHHWISGNLPLSSECEVCEEVCGDGAGIVDLRCCWCQRNVHNKCHQQLSEICDLGEFSRFVVPPYCVKTEERRSMIGRNRHWRVITGVAPPAPSRGKPWTPLVVIGNKKSGNNDGAAILAAFRGHLNPSQVTDLDDAKIDDALKWCRMLDGLDVDCLVLVAGGDGTIGWVLNTIDKMGLKRRPSLVLLPLGTGNDLSRTLNYGSGADASVSVVDVMRDVARSEKVLLDRWKIDVDPMKHFGIKLPMQTIYMQNYVSIGVDALVTYNFHKARESPFYVMSSRLINKLIYFSYGTKDILERDCKHLDKILDLYLDDKKVDLPSIESVVVLNIPYWAAGVRPWEMGSKHSEFATPSYSDKKLEVFCIYSSFHIAQMQVGLSEPHRIGQAEKVRIVLHGSAPMQTDGEPWEQHPAEIVITHHNQIPVMKRHA